MYPEARSVGLWLRHGWHIAVAYVVGFFIMFAVIGWHPDQNHRERMSKTFPVATEIGVLPGNLIHER